MAFNFTASELAAITHGSWYNDKIPAHDFTSLYTDSRNWALYQDALFVAIIGDKFNGHDFCVDLAHKGQRFFIVSQPLFLPSDCFQLRVEDTLKALQALAAAHRTRFKGQVIGITGSNGKTIVKEWLFELLTGFRKVFKSPKSYNSQIGVALSLLQAPLDADFYIIEAGISQKGEMQLLEQMIQPQWGIFTHLGAAHREGFSSDFEKFQEKCALFERSTRLLIPLSLLQQFVVPPSLRVLHKLITLGDSPEASFNLIQNENQLRWNDFIFDCPFSDSVSIHNMRLALSMALVLGIEPEALKEKLKSIRSVPMRLEWMEGNKGATILNDSWTNDPDALHYALAFLFQVKKQEKTCVILSDYPEGAGQEVYKQAASLLHNNKPDLLLAIGPVWSKNKGLLPSIRANFFVNTAACIEYLSQIDFSNTAILIKGSRAFSLEKIARYLQVKQHETQLEINLDKLIHNYESLRLKAGKSTKMMAMVKAFAYGSGEYEVAKVLEYRNIDYFSVAFLDEGIALRKTGIRTPIMVLNPGSLYEDAWHLNQLEPAIGSLQTLQQFAQSKQSLAVHIELDTGMHRLGFQEQDIDALLQLLSEAPWIKVKSIFTHLAAAEDPALDHFTMKQKANFHAIATTIMETLGYQAALHLSNSSALQRFGNLGGTMVRPGLALYGYLSSPQKEDLLPVFAFKTHISQIKEIAPGEGIGYGLHSVSELKRRIAILPVGYADGFSRKFSQGAMSVAIRGVKAPVVGNVCMDMCMVDVSAIHCQVGEEVELFGDTITVEDWSKVLDSIPYEVFTSISQRVRRVFVSEK
jgi:alanine racemase